MALTAICLLTLVHCFGGWQVPLDAQGNPIDPGISGTTAPGGTPDSNSATTPTPSSTTTPVPDPGASPSPNPVASPSPNPVASPAPSMSPSPMNGNTCQPIADFFNAQMWTPIMSTTCVGCHQDTGNPFHLTANDPATSLTATEAEAKKTDASNNNMSLLLLKPTGTVTHGGGMLFSTTSSTYASFQAFVTAVQSNASCVMSP